MNYSNKCNSNEEDKQANMSPLCLSGDKIGDTFNALSSQKKRTKEKVSCPRFRRKKYDSVVHCHMWEE